ncbi:dihydrodipicolinate synthase family protein [Labrys wisconsinensis]|uniref:Dihydrodipicolinate synthase family protein n=1 Tax=Labrys wisconsinensis TaxID=425677 RepID=A0ABU0JLY3_9HYPH|nr:dihydrodipicolinate synthase family protein [Labrys wisconsinensis]MDQ0474137.1 hypothetical protein [Labrys wisconsinensis]
MTTVLLPTPDGRTEPYALTGAAAFPARGRGAFPRVAYAAAHVVADARALEDPWRQPRIDWEATLRFRHHLWDLGFKVAEAMDTAQRGMGLDWPGAAELIRRVTAEARSTPGADLACGVGTDQLEPGQARSLADVVAAYEAQLEHVEACGGRAILMASRALCRLARGPDDYLAVYDRLIGQARGKVVLHWLGDMFDPALAGYWGSYQVDAAMATVLALIEARADRIEGIKISLLEVEHEVRLRRALPEGVKMFTGDDFNYPGLIAGDGDRHSHALLGIFDAIAPAAAAALEQLGAGDVAAYHRILDPTVALSRKLFEAPTQFYKAGIVFLAWLNGFQDHFRMVGGLESARGILHYAEVFRLADQAGLLADPDRAAARMRHLGALAGIG